MADEITEAAKADADNSSWMSDVQRAIAIMLIGTFAFIVIAVTIRLVISGAADTLDDMAKTLQAALVNMGLIALGFFFGSSMSKRLADAGQQKIVERLISPPNGTGPGGAPAAAIVAAAEAAAPAAAAVAAPPAAAEAAPPAAEDAVKAELDERGFTKPKE